MAILDLLLPQRCPDVYPICMPLSFTPIIGARGHSDSLLALTIHILATLILTTLCKSIVCNYSLICSHCMKNRVYYGYVHVWNEMTLLHIFVEMYTYKDVTKQ